MDIVFIDIETFWSKDHSLTKMSPLKYVMHPETEIISCSIKRGNKPASCTFGEELIRERFAEIDWSNTMAVAHNMSGFDAMILAWRFGIKPKMWGCTLAMARPIHSITVGGSLAKLVKHYGIGEKDSTALIQTQGKKLADFTNEERYAMAKYNRADTEQCAQLFHKLKVHYTAAELWHIDASIRMLVEPKFLVDHGLLETALSVERSEKHKALLELASDLRMPVPDAAAFDAPAEGELNWHDEDAVVEFVRSELASTARFAKLLESWGVEVPTKPSPTNPDTRVPALAKTDEAFIKLQDHQDRRVATAARTRLSVKSTLLETRIQAFLDACDATEGWLPVPLHYCGAATTGRWSGWLYNPQNLPRVPRDKNGNIVHKTSNALRMCMRAPKGAKVIVADLSGIELRVNHFLWRVPSSMSLFQKDPAKADLYKDFASRLYDVPESEVSKDQRQIGKIAHLGLGFGAGPATFQRIAKMMGGVDMELSDAAEVTYKWREEYQPIVAGWKKCHSTLPSMLTGGGARIDPWGLCTTVQEGIRLPSGRLIRYPGLRNQGAEKGVEWFYGEGRNTARIYAGKIDENIVQALARDVIADCALEFYRQTKLRPQLAVHDELVYVVDDKEADELLAKLQQIMRTPPKWWPELVTWSEGDVADSYGLAK